MKKSCKKIGKHLYRLNQSDIKDFFIKCVEGFGGKMKTGVWYYVQRMLFQQYGIEVDKPEYLRAKYELFTCPPVKFESDEMRVLMESFFDCQFQPQNTFALYKERMGQFPLNHRQFKLKAKIKTALTRCMLILFNTFCCKRNKEIFAYKQIKITSTILLLKTTTRNDTELSEDSKQIKQSGLLLSELIKVIIKNYDLKRPYMFEILNPICNRRQVEMILQLIYYFHELRQVYQLRYSQDSQLSNHPFLKRTLAEIKKDSVYLQFISDDWINKLKMFTNCQEDQEIEDKIIIRLNKDNKQIYQEQAFGNIQPIQNSLKKVKSKQHSKIIQTKRSIRLPEDIIRRHNLTVNFNQAIEEDQQESEDSLQEEFQRYFEMQNIENQIHLKDKEQQKINRTYIIEKNHQVLQKQNKFTGEYGKNIQNYQKTNRQVINQRSQKKKNRDIVDKFKDIDNTLSKQKQIQQQFEQSQNYSQNIQENQEQDNPVLNQIQQQEIYEQNGNQFENSLLHNQKQNDDTQKEQINNEIQNSSTVNQEETQNQPQKMKNDQQKRVIKMKRSGKQIKKFKNQIKKALYKISDVCLLLC